MLEIEIPFPPSVNHYWRRVGHRTLISREGRAFRARIARILAVRRLAPLEGPLEMDMEVYPPDRRRRDLDNLWKAVLDAFEHGGAYLDDSQFVRLQIFRRPRIPGGKAIVRITCGGA